MAELLPPYPVNGLSIVGGSPSPDAAAQVRAIAPSGGRSGSRLSAGLPPSSALRQLSRSSARWRRAVSGGTPSSAICCSAAAFEALGSNNWVVDGTLTASGKPLLANDPHLGTHVPSLWYLAHMSAGDFDVIGATLPGAPAVAIGRNRFIAWGETNVAADVEDLFLERIDPSGKTAEFRGAQEPIRDHSRNDRGEGRRADSPQRARHAPRSARLRRASTPTTRSRRRRPKPPPLEPLAFRWTALDDDDSTVVAFLRAERGAELGRFHGSAAALRRARRRISCTPTSTGTSATTRPGRIPVRASGDGSTARRKGGPATRNGPVRIPFEELPHAFDPPEHFIVTANNRPMPADYPHLIALEYPEPYRAQRITDLIAQKKQLDAGRFRGHSGRHAVAPRADAAAAAAAARRGRRSAHPAGARAFSASGISTPAATAPASAIFQAWFRHLAPAIVGDELGPLAHGQLRGPLFVHHALRHQHR